jgi:AraC family transcriptional regulator
MKRFLKHTFSLLNVEYVKLNRNWDFKNVLSPYYRLYYIDAGEGLISTDHASLVLEPGYLYLIPSFTLCSLSCKEYMGQFFIQFFEDSSNGLSLFQHNRTIIKVPALEIDIENIKRILQINPGRGINRSNNPKVYEKHIYYEEYQELNNNQSTAVFIETQGIIYQLISRFLTLGTFRDLSMRTIPEKILDAMNFIQVNLKLPLTVASLSQRANLHQDYFSRLFLQHSGQRPLPYIQEKKIERAQYLMTTTRMSYAEISEETGFGDVSYFSRVFKKTTGSTPDKYKRRNLSVQM